VQVAREARNVDRVLVGNEAVLRGDLTPAQMVGYLESVRRQVRQPVSTAEPWHVWVDHPELGQAVDFITIHLLPYWEGLPVEDALRFIMEKRDQVQAMFPGKTVVIGEVGWPSDGRDIGAARATRVNQALFMRRFFNIAEQRGLEYFVMEAFDQPWKVAFEGRAAGHWGMYDLDRAPKWPLTGPVSETPSWLGWALGASFAAFLATFFFLARRPDIRWQGQGDARGRRPGLRRARHLRDPRDERDLPVLVGRGRVGRARGGPGAAARPAAVGRLRAGGDGVGAREQAPLGRATGTRRDAAAEGLNPPADLQRAAGDGPPHPRCLG
jgi:hypothetical protein